MMVIAAFFLRSLLLTILIEGFIAWLKGIRTVREQLMLLAVNVITNPLCVYAAVLWVQHYGSDCRLPGELIPEILVFLTEALLFRYFFERSRWEAVGLSLILNGSSYSAGLFLGLLF